MGGVCGDGGGVGGCEEDDGDGEGGWVEEHGEDGEGRGVWLVGGGGFGVGRDGCGCLWDIGRWFD